MGARRWFLTIAGCATLAGCGASAGEGAARAPVVFADNCGPCHGPNGQGNPSIGAPAIAGLPVWYVQAQLTKFRDGIRGAHPDDAEGLRMRPMARTLEARDVEAVAAFVATLPPDAPDHTLTGGSADAGKAAFGTCSACHGPEGKGTEALGAPPIAQMDDWYLARQIGKFKAGIRGTNPRDTTGATMRPMAQTLKDEQAVLDVIAHIGTLHGGN